MEYNWESFKRYISFQVQCKRKHKSKELNRHWENKLLAYQPIPWIQVSTEAFATCGTFKASLATTGSPIPDYINASPNTKTVAETEKC